MNFFDITLPSIPGKNIKFKIQDIKSIGFSRQAPRFKEDKTFLTKRFIDSFKNFQEKNDADESEAETKISLCCSCMTEKPADEFRYIVPETKKYLVPKYEEMKNYTPSEKKQIKGFSFTKSKEARKPLQTHEEISVDHCTNNYYFSSQQPNQQDKQCKTQRNQKPSAVFKREFRWAEENRQRKQHAQSMPSESIKLEPNTPKSELKSQKNTTTESKGDNKKRPRRLQGEISTKKKKKPNHNGLDNAKLKSIITSILQPIQPPSSANVIQKEKSTPSYMFLVDDRDRFGEQRFPIAPKLNLPGPGTYKIPDTLEDKANLVLIAEKQKKLLQEWFNC